MAWLDSLRSEEATDDWKLGVWAAIALAVALVLWQIILAYQLRSVQHELATHETREGVAVVATVSKLGRRYRGCTIEISANLTTSTGRSVAVRGPGGYLGFVDTEFKWFDCAQRSRPAAYSRMIASGDAIPVVYAVDDPYINRPAWVDYPAIIGERRAVPTIACIFGLSLYAIMRFLWSKREQRPTPSS